MGSLFPDPPRRHTFAKLEFKLTAREDCDGDCLKLITALLFMADGNQSVVATRDEIREVARLSRNKYFKAMAWLRSVNAITEPDEPSARSGKRIVLEWVRNPAYEPPTHQEDQHAGAPKSGAPKSGALAPPKQARLYLISENEEENTVPSVTEETPSRGGAREADDGTDGTVCASLSEEIKTREERSAEILAKVGGDPKSLNLRTNLNLRPEWRVIQAELEQLRAGDLSCLAERRRPKPRPPTSPGLPAIKPATSAPPPRDDAVPLASVFAALGSVKAKGRTAARDFARLLAARHGDQETATLATFEKYALLLRAGWIQENIAEIERDPNVKHPTRIMSTRFKKAYAARGRPC